MKRRAALAMDHPAVVGGGPYAIMGGADAVCLGVAVPSDDAPSREIKRLIADHAAWQRASVESRRSICALSDEYKARAEAAEAVIERVRTHSKAVRMIVESAETYVRTDGRDGLRHGEKR